MLAVRIAYDGRDYHGFQRQPDVPTVSDAILDALRALDVPFAEADDGETTVPPGYAAAGRTDAGVSAVAQTVAFEAPDWLTPSALNGELPPDVRAWASADVPETFHATHDAVSREYTYYLYAPDADDEAARRAGDRFAGRHDFHNLSSDDDGTVRELSIDLTREDRFLVVTVRADGFPRQLVRRLVSVVDEFASGTSGPDRIDRVLGDEPLPGPAGVQPAPPGPLVLTGVTYPSVRFEPDDEAVESRRSVFEARRVERRTAARVARRLAER